MNRRGMIVAAALAGLLGGCATGAPTAESVDRAECKAYAHSFDRHTGRMWDACMISRGYEMVYGTNAGWVEVKSKVQPGQPPEVVAKDLVACNAEGYASYEGRERYAKCMDQRGYAVTVR